MDWVENNYVYVILNDGRLERVTLDASPPEPEPCSEAELEAFVKSTGV